jgi:hypothetical protein
MREPASAAAERYMLPSPRIHELLGMNVTPPFPQNERLFPGNGSRSIYRYETWRVEVDVNL